MKNKTILLTIVLLLIPLAVAAPFSSQIHSPSITPSIPLNSIFVNNIGAATYSIPLEVPPGINNLQPTLALSYNSYAVNSYPGLVGSGWTLTESYVQRDVNFTAQDTSDDEFILVLRGQPQQLVDTGSDYHTKIESFLMVNYEGNTWQVRSKDGTLYNFSQKLDSNLNNYTWRWYLSEVEDTFANKIFYSYQENPFSGDNGTLYLSQISYNNDQSRKISFRYENLPNSWGIIDNGNLIRRTSRVNRVEINASGDLVRRYDFSYTGNDISSRSYLSSIKEYGSDGSSSLPVTSFNYTALDIGWYRDSDVEDDLPDLGFSWEGVDSGTRALDFTRNGKIDFIQNANVTGNQSQTYEAWLNGYDEGSEQLMLPPMDMAFTAVEGAELIDRGVQLGDFNGDGLIDLIRGFNSTGGSSYEIWKNSGPFVGWNLSTSNFVTEFSNNNENQGVELVDLNGDGYADVVKAKEGQAKTSWVNDKNGSWSVDNNWNIPVYLITSDEKDTGTRLVDFNGDGLVDVYVSNATDKALWFNTGYGWQLSNIDLSYLPENINTSNADTGVRFADLNGDGLTDIVQAKGVLRHTLINNGSGFVENSTWDIPDQGEFVELDGENEGTRLIDVNNDGSIDVVRMKRNGASLTKAAWVNLADQQSLLSTIHLPSGNTMRFDYIRSSEATDEWDSGFNQWVLESVSQYDDLDHRQDNGFASCMPSSCPVGYVDQGIDCSGSTCNRSCVSYSCGSYTTVKNSAYTWNDLDDASINLYEYALELDSYQASNSDSFCYRVTTSSDTGIVDASDIDFGSPSSYDSVMALSWGISGFSEQSWDGYCKLSDDGDVMGSPYRFLRDDADQDDEDFSSADSIGGTWVGYCMPPDSECTGFSSCTTRCYGNQWQFIHHVDAAVNDAYVPDQAASSHGACQEGGPETSGPLARSIDYDTNDFSYVVERGNVGTSHDDQVCQKTPAVVTTYQYGKGEFDYGDREFRGFDEVTETRPDGVDVVHHYHQDDALKGLEFKTETGSIKTSEYFYDNSTQEGYYTITLGETKTTDYTGIAQIISGTNFTYDQYGNVASINHSGEYGDSSDDHSESFEYTYNTNDWIVDNAKHHVTRNNDGTIFSEEWFYYDNHTLDASPSRGAVTKHVQWLDTGADIEMNYQYDSNGNLINETNGRGFLTTYEYEDTNTYPNNITDALSQSILYGYDIGTGNILNHTDANGYTTFYEYDVFGRKTKEVQPDDSSSNPTTSWQYHFDGIAPEIVNESRKVNTNERQEQLSFYDGFSSLAQIKTEADSSQQIVKNLFYNPIGQLSNESNNYFVSAGGSYVTPNTSVPATELTYDALGRVTQVINPDDSKISTTYFLWERADYDENGNQVNTTTDAFGRIVLVEEIDSSNIYTTSYQNDLNNNVILIIDDLSNEFAFTYDSVGRLSQLNDPDLGQWNYLYDGQDNLLTQTDANGNQIAMAYDALDRVVNKTVNNDLFTYNYDVDTVGTLSYVNNSDSVMQYFYDERLRPIKQVKTIDTQSTEINITYDSLDRVTSEKVADGETITYDYSLQGLDDLNSEITIDYNAHNQPTSRTYSNGKTTQLAYYTANKRVKEISTSTIQDFKYNYDSVGNVIQINDSGNLTSISYDDLDRLINADSNSFNISYSYDHIGNILALNNTLGENVSFLYQSGPIHAPSGSTANGSSPGNYAPVVTTPAISPDHANTSSRLSVTTTYTDANGDLGTVNITWYVNDVDVYSQINTSIPTGTSIQSILNAGNFSENDVVNVSVYANDGTEDSAIKWSQDVVIQDIQFVPEITTPIISPNPASFITYTFLTSTNYTDLNGDVGTIYFQWYVNDINVYNQTNYSINSGTTVVSKLEGYLNSGDRLNVSVYANDGLNDSILKGSDSVIVNYLPNVTIPTISPDPADDLSTLYANTTYTDVENNLGLVIFSWTVNNVVVYVKNYYNVSNGTVVVDNFMPGNFTAGDFINVSAIADDGIDDMEEGFYSQTILINGLAPNITTPEINPNHAYEDMTLSANTTYTDPYDDAGTIYFQWYVNDINVYNQTFSDIDSSITVVTNLNPGNFTANDTINVSVYAIHGSDPSIIRWAQELTIFGILGTPNMTAPVLSPDPAYENSILSASSIYTDPNADSGTIYFFWYVNNVNVYNQTNSSIVNGTSVIASLNPGNFTANDIVNISVYANDGSSDSTLLSSTIFINTLPSAADEQEARTAIGLGINASLLSDYLTYYNQSINVRYLNNSQKSGQFDFLLVKGSQAWALNYISEGESFTTIDSLYNNTLVVWENQSLTSEEIAQQINTLINTTLWQ
ncbi:hypothetical protein COV20_03225 [Candidatus Woesearchaeota archaeon CG10_big_fil_rev_8_21_14_0_10_45_16]|nr:MAG: hypothetical protein COV20_03225 [Candidatus Woesearchaeota archaeon CG10_big_fil_rev_8_21_14_0_10_45_16]